MSESKLASFAEEVTTAHPPQRRVVEDWKTSHSPFGGMYLHPKLINIGMRCKYCNQEKLETDFEISKKVNGKEYRRKKCKRCKQDTQNKRREKTKEWLTEYKKTLTCSKCGIEDYRVIQFHHVDGKDRNVSEMLTYSITAIENEIKKCIPLCANCHIIEHQHSE